MKPKNRGGIKVREKEEKWAHDREPTWHPPQLPWALQGYHSNDWSLEGVKKSIQVNQTYTKLEYRSYKLAISSSILMIVLSSSAHSLTEGVVFFSIV